MASSPEAQQLLERWRLEKEPSAQKELLDQLFTNGIFPNNTSVPTWDEYDTFTKTENDGLYPDMNSDTFLEKLMKKQEFHESKQPPISEKYAMKKDTCRSTEEFEISPVQRFIARFLSPTTPYNSALLYHGVGVGKTCAAITVCESYLELNPNKKAIIIAPPNIQEGFKRTIFDIEALEIGVGDSPNRHRGCTQNIYLQLTNSTKDKNKAIIESRVDKAIKSRYEFFGYTSFYNYINSLTKALPKTASFEQRKRDIIRREFSNRIIIVDEAHNLRDTLFETEEDAKDFVADAEITESTAGKRLTPFLRDVLRISEGITLLLMTATPMYNSYTEIVFLLNLLLLNDKYPTIQVQEIFDLKAGKGAFVANGKLLLGKLASHYVSFMRGENPLTFPLRLKPKQEDLLDTWPIYSPKTGERIEDPEQANIASVLPCISCPLTEASEELYKSELKAVFDSDQGLGIANMDRFIQAGNWLFPGDEDTDFLFRIGDRGFDRLFAPVKNGAIVAFQPRDETAGAGWLMGDSLKEISPKTSVVIDRVNKCRGVAFVYSRFIKSGALTIALAMEANGYTAWGKDSPSFLIRGPKSSQGRQCALCPRREVGHGTVVEEKGTPAHTFKPAKYVLLTGSDDYSPNNAAAINAARASTNMYGADVKLIIGSQVAGEGLDLRYIREILVFDSWYHLNRLEQVVGRGIRNCSHALLDQQKRNCTIVLLVTTYSNNVTTETVDLYSYRQAFKKAIGIGNIVRTLKEFAVDCFLNKDAIIVKDIPEIPVLLDSQGEQRTNVDINDKGYTPMCDWLEDCEYSCRTSNGSLMRTTAYSLDEQDNSTYDEYSARYHIHTIRKTIQDRISKGQVYVTFDQLKDDFLTIPPTVLSSILNDIVSQDNIKIISKTPEGQEVTGHILRRGNNYLFQPDALEDESIPISLRLAHIPIPRDTFRPKQITVEEEEISEEVTVSEDKSESLWGYILTLASNMEKGAVGQKPISDELIYAVNSLSQSKGVSKAQKERMEMMLWIYVFIRENENLRKLYAQVIREYIWDEFIPSKTQQILLRKYGANEDDHVRKVAKYSFWTFQGTEYIRLVNTDTNAIEYLQVNPSTKSVVDTSTAVQEVLRREKAQDPITNAGINTRTTAYNYGFILYNPKVNRLVFKKGKPSDDGTLPRGSECSKNSTTRFEVQELLRYGGALSAAGMNTLGLTQEEMAKPGRSVTNSVRVCTLVDLALRMMNAMNLSNKRWFYRPLEATLYGHPLR